MIHIRSRPPRVPVVPAGAPGQRTRRALRVTGRRGITH